MIIILMMNIVLHLLPYLTSSLDYSVDAFEDFSRKRSEILERISFD